MKDTTFAEISQLKKIAFEEPDVVVLGAIEELTGEGGANCNDGWGYGKGTVM